MSDTAILQGVTAYLIDKLADWDANNCKGMPDGQPEPMQGDIFAAVHITQLQTVINADDGMLEELWGFGVTVTKRITAIPYDKLVDSIYITHLTGLSPIMQRIKFCLHNRWSLTQGINDNIVIDDTELNQFVDETAMGFLSPAYLINRTPTMVLREEEWMHGVHSSDERTLKDGFVAVSMTLNYGNLLKQTKLATDTCP